MNKLLSGLLLCVGLLVGTHPQKANANPPCITNWVVSWDCAKVNSRTWYLPGCGGSVSTIVCDDYPPICLQPSCTNGGITVTVDLGFHCSSSDQQIGTYNYGRCDGTTGSGTITMPGCLQTADFRFYNPGINGSCTNADCAIVTCISHYGATCSLCDQ